MAAPILISGGMVLADGGFLRRGDILVEGKKIRRIAPRLRVRGARVFPARGLLAAPGLIDTHICGGFGVSFGEADPGQVREVARRLPEQGVTAFLPTLIPLSRPRMVEAIRTMVAAAERPGGARLLGIHLEGPFLCPREREGRWARHFRRPSLPEFREYLRAGRGLLRLMTIAPELPGALEVIREGARRGVVMSAGHSRATAAQVGRAVLEGGLRHVTHVFNAMAPFHHRDETILNAALLIDRLSCGMIYDGVHLSPGTATLLMKLKPPGSLVLASDASAALGLPDGGYSAHGERFVIRDGQVRVRRTGRLAGTVVTLGESVRRLIEDTGIPPSVAVYMASGAPAKLLGLEGRKGSLHPGADADIVLFEPGLRVRATFVEGDLVHGNHH